MAMRPVPVQRSSARLVGATQGHQPRIPERFRPAIGRPIGREVGMRGRRCGQHMAVEIADEQMRRAQPFGRLHQHPSFEQEPGRLTAERRFDVSWSQRPTGEEQGQHRRIERGTSRQQPVDRSRRPEGIAVLVGPAEALQERQAGRLDEAAQHQSGISPGARRHRHRRVGLRTPMPGMPCRLSLPMLAAPGSHRPAVPGGSPSPGR